MPSSPLGAGLPDLDALPGRFLLASVLAATEEVPAVDAGIQGGDTVFLSVKATNLRVTVELDTVHAKWGHKGLWQAIIIERDEKGGGGKGGPLESGDRVLLQAHNGRHIAVNGADVEAKWQDERDWLVFVIEKAGGGFIESGDTVTFTAHTGNRLAAENGLMTAKSLTLPYTQEFVIEVSQLGPFDGRWTEKDDPGRDVFIIKGDALHFVDAIETGIYPTGNNKFTTGLQGKTAHKGGELVDGEIHWSNGDVWIPVKGTFDGRWTNMNHAKKGTFIIEGDTIHKVGGKKTKITKLDEAEFSTVEKDAPAKTAELVGFEIHWENGEIWVPLEAGQFDGRWTGKGGPGGDFFDIEGDMLFFDEGLESKITPNGTGFTTELVGNRLHSKAQLVDGELRWINGDIWVPYHADKTDFWVPASTSTSTSTVMRTTETATTTMTESATTTMTESATTTTTETTRTSTTTSHTVSTITTTTTRSLCLEEDSTYEPMDMDGTNLTFEENWVMCQRRCAATKGCTHFSYWHLGMPLGHCHLQDIFALKQFSRFGFVAGPPRCFDNIDYRTKNLHRLRGGDMGNKTFVPYAYRCVKMSSMWAPFTKQVFLQADLKPKQAVRACRELCLNTTDCGKWSIEFPAKHCSLSPKDAVEVHPVFKHVAGPNFCDDEDEDSEADKDFIEEFLEEQDLSQRRARRPAATLERVAVPLTAVFAIFGLALHALRARRCSQLRQCAQQGEEEAEAEGPLVEAERALTRPGGRGASARRLLLERWRETRQDGIAQPRDHPEDEACVE